MISPFRLFVVLILFFSMVSVGFGALFGLEAERAEITYDPETNYYEVTYEQSDLDRDGLWQRTYISRDQLIQEMYVMGLSLDAISGYEDLGDTGRFEREYNRYAQDTSSITSLYLSLNEEDKISFEETSSRLGNEQITTFFGNLDDYEQMNWDALDTSTISRFIDSGLGSENIDIQDVLEYAQKEEQEWWDDEEKKDLRVRQQLLIDLLVDDMDLLSDFYSTSEGISEFEDLLEDRNTCEGSIWNFYCVLNDKLTEREAFTQAYQTRINEIIANADSVDEANAQIREETDRYLERLTGKACSNNEGLESGSSAFQTCMNNYIDTINEDSFCEDIGETGEGNSCSTIKSIVRDIVRAQSSNELIEVGSVYYFVEGLLNPDQMGVNAARLFGFEANYADLPPFIRDDLGTSMCIGKINGYLDKDVEANRGVTRYEVTNTSRDILITGDIRAQRTEITPDNKTAITYSYFIRAPEDFSLTYLLALSYIDGSGNQKVSILEPQPLPAGESSSGFDNIAITVDDPETVERDSFRIGLLGVKEGTQTTHLSLIYPIILISSGDSYFKQGSIANDEGNSQVTGAGDNNNSLDESDMLDLLFT